MKFTRKDRGGTAHVLAVVGQRVLVSFRWRQKGDVQDRENILFLPRAYFSEKYGANAATRVFA